MGVLPLLQQGRNVPVCLANADLPEFYMNDYSVLGLLVASLDRAHQVLTDKDFAVDKKAEHLEVDVHRADQLSEIVNLLSQNGIDCGVSDIVDQVYQG